jgi:murein DD-endopeptidase MepM/ murein hydrolase activator NlpD
MNKFMLLLFFTGCASANNPIQKEMVIKPGEVRWLELDLAKNDVELFCRNRPIKVHRVGTKIQAVIMESYFSDLSPFTCDFNQGQQTVAKILFKVVNRDYKAEKLKVDPKTIKLSTEDQARADSEQVVLNKIYSSSLNRFQFSTSFKEPMTSLVTSLYGTKRVYNRQKKSQHLGIDYRAAIGDQVPATNAGKIVYAGDLFYTGWTVIIDHGLDIFSVYGHLSKTLVKEGQFVVRGELIGLSGNTGRTSGPHLHWGVKVQGQYVDGFVLIDETKKVFQE